MGKIFSPPKMPSAPAVVYVPEPVAPAPVAAAVTETDPPASGSSSDADAAPEVTPDEQRLQNILTRRRGRVGTIGTSFSGVLNDTNSGPVRKTLLGE